MPSIRSIVLLVSVFFASSLADGVPTVVAVDPSALASTAPPITVIVDATAATAGSFKTVQEGVMALSNTSNTTQTLFIKRGTYNEQVYIRPLRSPLIVRGETNDSSSYSGNTVTIIGNLSRNSVPTNDLTATVRNFTPNSKFYNLNIENNFGHTSKNGQNLALSAQASGQGYYGCSFVGYQDTILAQKGNQLYAKSKIVGVVDFIFGEIPRAWFDGVDIRTFGKGYITASGRATADDDSWFVINNSTVSARDNNVTAGSTFLGRPWKEFARVVFQNSKLSDVVNPAGWSQWSNATQNTANSTLAEFGNTGPGAAKTGRAAFAKQLDQPITIESILGASWASDFYVDTSYVSK